MSALDLKVVDELLSTTRSVRKRLDLERPVDPAAIDECLELSLQAPTGGNAQGWRWLVVTDAQLRAGLADIYARASAGYLKQRAEELAGSEDRQNAKVFDSAAYLVDVLHRVPVHVIPCIRGRRSDDAFGNASLYGSILPAVWSFMLAARARGLGTSWTTLHLTEEKAAAEMLGIPDTVMQGALIPVAHTLGGTDFKPGARRDLDRIIHTDGW
jgi:nitroreductase